MQPKPRKTYVPRLRIDDDVWIAFMYKYHKFLNSYIDYGPTAPRIRGAGYEARI